MTQSPTNTDNSSHTSLYDTSYRFSVAPMMAWTDRHYRFFARQLTKKTLLYTEMISDNTLIHGNRDFLMKYHPTEHPLACQLGGSDPEKLKEAVQIVENYSYDEINLNLGCPSPRVKKNSFGACLMKDPKQVERCLNAMQSATKKTPITVKTRIGVDDLDSFEFIQDFIARIQGTGVKQCIIHARKAWLHGLSPKENREIPPLQYETVYRLKEKFPDLVIVINGGIKTIEQAQHHLKYVDGCMVGRAAYETPYILSTVDRDIFHDDTTPILTREEAIGAILPYAQHHVEEGGKISHITQHLLGLFHGQRGGRLFRRSLSENAHKKEATHHIIKEAMHHLQED